ncbi:MAG: AtpZ/AtpI family protein [Dehalococcoidia bacterium]|nr:AtpZ/AtpI family protein [Dehalococcoidia bacterium]
MGGRKLALAFQLLGVGWFVAICIGGGTAGGYLLDRQFGFSPGLTLTGLFFGIAIAVIGMYRMLMAILRRSDDD